MIGSIYGVVRVSTGFSQPGVGNSQCVFSGKPGETNPVKPRQPRNPSLPTLAKQIADCEAKSTFRTKGRALRFIDRSGYPLAPYRCGVCGEWHLAKEGKG